MTCDKRLEYVLYNTLHNEAPVLNLSLIETEKDSSFWKLCYSHIFCINKIVLIEALIKHVADLTEIT
jgi:hypothetical protein